MIKDVTPRQGASYLTKDGYFIGEGIDHYTMARNLGAIIPNHKEDLIGALYQIKQFNIDNKYIRIRLVDKEINADFFSKPTRIQMKVLEELDELDYTFIFGIGDDNVYSVRDLSYYFL